MFAVPGEITSALSSAGSNALLRLGATPLTCAEDVLESFGIVAAERAQPALGADGGVRARRTCARRPPARTSWRGRPDSRPASSRSR